MQVNQPDWKWCVLSNDELKQRFPNTYEGLVRSALKVGPNKYLVQILCDSKESQEQNILNQYWPLDGLRKLVVDATRLLESGPDPGVRDAVTHARDVLATLLAQRDAEIRAEVKALTGLDVEAEDVRVTITRWKRKHLGRE